jgi:hypothetical protein
MLSLEAGNNLTAAQALITIQIFSYKRIRLVGLCLPSWAFSFPEGKG